MHNVNSEQALARILFSMTRAAAQTERAAMRQCQREADRLRHAASVGGLLAIAQHARASLGILPCVIERDGHVGSLLVGPREASVFAELREVLSSLLLENERAYRSTLLNLRHGVVLMENVGATARVASSLALSGFCEAWISTRVSLIEQAESELIWLVHHPEKGTEQRWLGERDGRKGASNVGEDETSGSE
jgi:hypothetical protein